MTKAQRRHVRLRAALRIGAREVAAATTYIAVDEVYVRVQKQELGAEDISQDSAVSVSLCLPDCSAVELRGDVLWTNPSERDALGRETVGVAIALAEPNAELAAFIDKFRYTILAVDDEPLNLEVLGLFLKNEYKLHTCSSGAEALEFLESNEVSVIIADHRMPEMTGLEMFKELSQRMPDYPAVRIVLSAYRDPDELQAFINHARVFYWLEKPLQVEAVQQIVKRAVEAYATTTENASLSAEVERSNVRLRRENAYLRQQVKGLEGFEHIVGTSAELRKALSELNRIRRSEAPVQITGETGTGKELVARALHFGGPRKDKPFIAQNCAGMTESLLQSTLFGHQKGAFTGADRDRRGVFQEAHGGTLFLDEVAEMSPATQAVMLRALQEGEVVPVGASKPVKVDVRVLSATHKDLREEVKAGRFREDLYFRMVVISVKMPSLRERLGDVPILAKHFLDLVCERSGRNIPGIEAEAMAMLENYDWPGNVRELENELRRMVVLGTDGEPLGVDLLSEHIRSAAPRAVPVASGVAGFTIPYGLSFDEAMTSLERALVDRALAENDGVVTRAADALRMNRSRLSKLTTRLGINK